MDGREFVTIVKRYAVDGAVQDVISSLKSPRLPKGSLPPAMPQSPFEQAMEDWLNRAAQEEQACSEWFNSLNEGGEKILKDLLADCAERTAASLFTLLDGVGGPFEGVFEVVAIDSKEKRHLVNPENSEMLHDLFSEVCEEDRRQQAG